jgi:hypothetical protein
MEKRKKKFDGGADLYNDGNSPPYGPCKLARGERRSPRSHLGHRQVGERKKINNKDLIIYHRSRAAHNIYNHPYFMNFKFCN